MTLDQVTETEAEAVRELAGELLRKWFHRSDDTSEYTGSRRVMVGDPDAPIYALDDAPDWVGRMCRRAHRVGERDGDLALPDDWRYEAIHQALCAIEAGDTPPWEPEAFAFSDDYHALLGYLERHQGWGRTSEVIREESRPLGGSDALADAVRWARYREAEEVANVVWVALLDQVGPEARGP